MFFNLPTLFTWARILAIPLVVGVYYTALPAETQNVVGTALFIIVSLTDWADGYLARRLGMTSSFGAFLDPVADKLFVSAALLVLVHLGRVHALIALIIIGREIAISALREWMAQIGRSRNVAVAFVGKIKTVAQMTALIALLLWEPLIPGVSTPLLGTIALWVAAILTLWSMFHYLRLAAPHFSGDAPPESDTTTRVRPKGEGDRPSQARQV